MENGYKIRWTDHALVELAEAYRYLELNFGENELHELSVAIDNVLQLISLAPDLYPKSSYKNLRRVIIKKFNTLYYLEKEDSIEIISFFSNRKNPL